MCVWMRCDDQCQNMDMLGMRTGLEIPIRNALGKCSNAVLCFKHNIILKHLIMLSLPIFASQPSSVQAVRHVVVLLINELSTL